MRILLDVKSGFDVVYDFPVSKRDLLFFPWGLSREFPIDNHTNLSYNPLALAGGA